MFEAYFMYGNIYAVETRIRSYAPWIECDSNIQNGRPISSKMPVFFTSMSGEGGHSIAGTAECSFWVPQAGA